MITLKRQLESHGLRAEGLRLTVSELSEIKMPSILFVSQSHFVVADSICGEAIYLRDPAIGRVRLAIRALGRMWKGEALVISRIE